MEKFEPWQRNKEVDPEFPWHSRKDENGAIVYSIPMECLNNIPVDDSDGAKQYIYSWLPLFGGKGMRVYWEETTSREWAYDQKRWIDAEAKREERRPKHEIPVAEVLGDGTSDGNRKKEWKLLDDTSDLTDEDPEADEVEEQTEETDPGNDDTVDQPGEESETASKKLSYEPFRFPQTEPQALTLIELEKVRQYIKERQPRWWRAFYLKEWCGVDAKEIAAELDVDPSRVYQLVDAVRKLAQRYREETK